MGWVRKYTWIGLILVLTGCNEIPWNDPYPYADPLGNTLYSAFTERPHHLDPARSYSASEWPFLCQIVEPPLQYNYIKRPYVLEPLTAMQLPIVRYYDEQNKEINSKGSIAYSTYEIQIKPGIYYAPHPAFVEKYHNMPYKEAIQYKNIRDFKETGTKELTAEDYIYQIKRLAEPTLNSPIFGIMSKYIEGLVTLREQLSKTNTVEQDLRAYDLHDVIQIDRYTYRIRIKGHYPQFQFWLAMPFFSPVPWEVANFYAQPGLKLNDISLDDYPVGTGPYRLEENNPERRMVLVKNNDYRLGEKEVIKPFVEKVIFTLEKESIPYWNKFLQGYYDASGIQSDNFSSAFQVNALGDVELTHFLKRKNIQLQISVSPSVFYWGFNMLDDTVGGYTERARKLRQALAMAVNVQEFINIFLNGRGTESFGPIPQDIFGFEAQKKSLSKNIVLAKQYLVEAGYPKGLTLYFDAIASGNPDEVAIQQWLMKQFNAIGVTVVFRNTDYNRFQEKVRTGSAQMFFWGWNADYPDPENFLFLFYGPNGSALSGGENTSNYKNARYDQLFEQMRILEDGAQRFKIIQDMMNILQQDTPWIWGFYPKTFTLYHGWMQPAKPSGIINNALKYVKVNPYERAQKRIEWNKPIMWPLAALGLVCLLGILWVATRVHRSKIGIGWEG